MSATFNGMDWVRLADHVTPFDPTKLGHVSTFTAAVREARSLTARDLGFGMLDPTRAPTALWAGSTVYLILLEQIGKSLRPKGGRKAKGEFELEKAIRQFAPRVATGRQRKVLYALRCAWVHEFGLFNVNGRNTAYQHCFGLDDDASAPLVRWPGRRWDGVPFTPTWYIHHRGAVGPGRSRRGGGDVCESPLKRRRPAS
ncbi:MAG: hypothetical protein ACYC1D_11930 [Acidimicrobiales bacterium]